jgi:hypothetical protein
MIQKIEITKYIASQDNLSTDEKSLRKLITNWWANPRKKAKGGLRLTDEGFARLSKYIKFHKVKFIDGPIEYNNQLVIQLDNFIDCPWYVTKKEVFVASDKMAVQLILFSGNIARFSQAKAKSIKNQLTSD